MSGRRYTIKGDFWFDESDGIWKPSEFSKAAHWHIVLIQQFFKPNKSGVSHFVAIEEMLAMFPHLGSSLGGNGSDAFTRGLLARNFVFNDPEAVIRKGRGGLVTHRRSLGLVENLLVPAHIKKEIHREISQQPCALTGTRTRVEVDHREGRREDHDRYATSQQTIDDFQPLCAVANIIKREECSRCKKTDRRFDARKIGYPVGWLEGNAQYKGSCEGCYWYGVKEFRQALDYNKGGTYGIGRTKETPRQVETEQVQSRQANLAPSAMDAQQQRTERRREDHGCRSHQTQISGQRSGQ